MVCIEPRPRTSGRKGDQPFDDDTTTARFQFARSLAFNARGSMVFIDPALRFMKAYNPRIGEVGAEDLIDDGSIKGLTESGFVDKIFNIYKVSGK